MKFTATRLLLVFPFLLLILGGCDSRTSQSSTQPSVTPTQQSNQANVALTQQNTVLPSPSPPTNTQINTVTPQNSQLPSPSPSPATNPQINTVTPPNPQIPLPSPATTNTTLTPPNPQSNASNYALTYAAEAYYQKVLAEYGENYEQCLEQVAGELDELASGETQKQPSSKQLNVLFALDSSGSMVGKITGKTKLDLAKEAIASFANQLPKSAQVGLTVYGHKGSNKEVDKAISCAGIETLYPMSQLDNLRFNQAVDSFQPSGFTPLAATLEGLNQSFSTYDSATNQNIIYVVSDGIDNCDGDPVAAARQLHTSNAKVNINVIGLNVNRAARRQLTAVAEAGGGKYFSVRNAVEMNQVFDIAKKQLELQPSIAVNLENQNQVVATRPLDINQVFACITLKMNREFAQIMTKTNTLTDKNELNIEYNDYVLNRLKERQDKITAWRNQVQTELANQPNINVDQLKQQLATVTQ